jgi:hypothetical protein
LAGGRLLEIGRERNCRVFLFYKRMRGMLTRLLKCIGGGRWAKQTVSESYLKDDHRKMEIWGTEQLHFKSMLYTARDDDSAKLILLTKLSIETTVLFFVYGPL